MIFYLELDGRMVRKDADRVFQGSSQAHKVLVLTPYGASTNIEIAFTLPNGMTSLYQPMFKEILYEPTPSCYISAWSYVIPENILENKGTIGVSVLAKTFEGADTNVVSEMTSFTGSFDVEYSVIPRPLTKPTAPEHAELQDLYQLLLRYYNELVNVESTTATTLRNHIANKSNPHEVKAPQVPINPINGMAATHVQGALENLNTEVTQNAGDIVQNATDIGEHETRIGANETEIANIKSNTTIIENPNGGFIAGRSARGSGGSIVIGNDADGSGGAIAIGEGALASYLSIAIGDFAKAGTIRATRAIQLGHGTNHEANSLQVYNYLIMGADGTLYTYKNGTRQACATMSDVTTPFIFIEDGGSLPQTGEVGKMYFIKSTNPQEKNTFDEFIWTGTAWEQVGSTSFDFDPTLYATKVELDELKRSVAANVDGIAHLDEIKQNKLAQLDLDNIASINQMKEDIAGKQDALTPQQLQSIGEVSAIKGIALSNQENKQDKLTAGDGIKIENNVISVVGGGPVVDKKIYGVDQVGRSDPHNLPRTDDAIGKTFSDPASNNVITSDFDNCFPWSDIKEFTDDAGNVFIEIPKFYGKITANGDGTYKHQISKFKHEGFDTLFRDAQGNEFDYVRVGKYEASGSSAKAFSKTGQTCLVNININQSRAACMANGQGYHQYDFRIDAIIKELFMIEFATTDCQSIFRGYVDGNSAALQTGHCDGILTGSNPSNIGGKSACVYRGIENPFGNIWKWVDGINFRNEEIWLCLNPSQYASDKFTAPYENVGTRTSTSGYLSGITSFVEYPLLGYVSDTSGSESTYYCDYTYYSGGNRVLTVGGYWADGSYAGLWYWYGDFSSSYAYSSFGCRLCYTPLSGG